MPRAAAANGRAARKAPWSFRRTSVGPSLKNARRTLMQLAFLVPLGLRRGALEPRFWVDGASCLANLEIQRRRRAATRVADRRNGVTGGDALAHFLVEPFVVSVETEVPVTMVDDGQQPQAREPVRVHHAAVIDGAHCRALGSREQHSIPFHAAGARLPE